MSMKLTELTIAPEHRWSPVGAENPLKAVVKVGSDRSNVECVLSDEAMHRILDVCAAEIAAGAEAGVREFVASVRTFEGPKSSALISQGDGE